MRPVGRTTMLRKLSEVVEVSWTAVEPFVPKVVSSEPSGKRRMTTPWL